MTTTPAPGGVSSASTSEIPRSASGTTIMWPGSGDHPMVRRANPANASRSRPGWAYPVSPRAIAAPSAAATGSARATSISAIHSGSTSGSYWRHFTLRRERSDSIGSWVSGSVPIRRSSPTDHLLRYRRIGPPGRRSVCARWRVVTRASRLSHAARESALRALLREHPDAWVVAIASSGLFTTMPPEVPLAGQSVIQGQSSGLEMVVPADQNLVLTAWQRVLTDGFASTAVHLPSDPDRPVGINLVDVRDQYGVVLGVFVSFPPENAVGQPSPLVPRSCRIHKDQGGVVTAADAPASGILGWAEDELLGQRMLDLIHPDDQNRAIANWMDMVSRPGSTRRVRLRHRHRDGSWRWLEVTNHNRLDDPLQPHVVADMVDVHDEVIGAEALRANERLLRRLTDALPVGVVHITAERRVDYYNERLGDWPGWMRPRRSSSTSRMRCRPTAAPCSTRSTT